MTNPMKPVACKIINVKHETELEYTFRVATDIKPQHGQFVQLSIPKIGEAPISVSEQGDGWLEFTIRKVGKVTNVIFEKEAGDTMFLRGPYGKGWPIDAIKGKHLVVVAGGTGVSPVRSLLNYCAKNDGFVKSVDLIAGFKNSDSILFKPELDLWREKFNATFCLDNEEKDGFKKGLVTTFVKDIPLAEYGDDYVALVVGPPIMMKFAGKELINCGYDENKIWMSFERKMSCAVGKCGHCRIDEVYVCLDGPVFPYTTASKLVD